MKLAKIAGGKRIKKSFIPLFSLMIISLLLSSGTVSAIAVYKLNNTFYDPNYETTPGSFEELIFPWEIKNSHTGEYNSYVGPTSLIVYPDEGIQYAYPKTQLPSEFNFTSRMYFLSWPTTDGDVSPMWQLCSKGWNTGDTGYVITAFELIQVFSNGTYLFRYNDYDTNIRIYVPNGSQYVYTLLVHGFFNSTSNLGTSYFNLTYELSTSEPGDEHYVNSTSCMWRYSLSGYDTVYIRLGGYSAGQYSSTGYTWIKYVKLWWDNGLTPNTNPPSSTEGIISQLVSQIVFFIPILVLTSLFGRIGFMGGVGLMSIIWMFADPSFVAPGVMIFISLGIFVYKGGMQ